MLHLGDYDTTETVYIPFNTFTSDDPSASCTITDLAAGDVEIHKDGSTTQRASDNGVTVSVDFDSVTGGHVIHVDLSDNSDAGFYAAGSRYMVRMEGTTIDGATVNAWIGAFSIGCVLRPTVAGRTADVTAGGCMGIDWGNVENPSTALDLSGTDIQLCDTTTTNTDMRGTDNANTTVPDAAGTPVTLADGAHGGSSTVLTLQQLVISNGSGIAVDIDGNSLTAGAVDIKNNNGTAGYGLNLTGQTYGVLATGQTHGVTFHGVGGSGLYVVGDGEAGIKASGPNAGIQALGSGANSDGIEAIATGTGKDVNADITGNLTGNVSGSVGSVTNAVETDAASRTASKATGFMPSTEDGSSFTAIPKTGYKLASDGVDLVLVDGKTLPAALQIIAAGVIGKISGARTGTEVFVGLDGSTTRATVTVDSSGNRTAVVYA